MHAFDRMCRAIAVGLLAVAVAVLAGPADAQKATKTKAAATALPEPLTQRIGARARVAPVRRGGAEAPDRPARSRRRAGEGEGRQGHVGDGRGERRNGARAARRAPGCVRRVAGDLARSRREAGRPRRTFGVCRSSVPCWRRRWWSAGWRSAGTILRCGIIASDSRRRPRRPSPRARFDWASGSPSTLPVSPCSRSPFSRYSSRSGRGTACGGSRSWRC